MLFDVPTVLLVPTTALPAIVATSSPKQSPPPVADHSRLEEENWGDSIQQKDAATIRIMFQNVNGLPRRNNEFNNRSLYGVIADHNIDIFMMSEINVNWRNIPEDHKLYCRMNKWFEALHISLANNVTEIIPDEHQWGGTGILSINKMSHRVMERGSDQTGLGRWCWTRYRGKNADRIQWKV